LVLNLALPGCVGAVIGVTVLSNVNGATLRPILAVLLTVIGIRILFRFARSNGTSKAQATEAEDESKVVPEHNVRGVRIAALVGGVTNGMIGAWGPVVTPFLLHRDVRPRFAIGSVNTAEVAVASASAFSLIASVGRGGFDVTVLVAMLLGGIVAAPVAAWLIRYIPPKPMGVAVASLLLLTNGKELAAFAGIRGEWSFAIYGVIAALVALVLLTVRPRALSPAPQAQ
jgi:uncharacterized membrane protein YfcA